MGHDALTKYHHHHCVAAIVVESWLSVAYPKLSVTTLFHTVGVLYVKWQAPE